MNCLEIKNKMLKIDTENTIYDLSWKKTLNSLQFEICNQSLLSVNLEINEIMKSIMPKFGLLVGQVTGYYRMLWFNFNFERLNIHLMFIVPIK